MKAHIFQHVPFESPAAIGDWLIENKFSVSYTLFYEEPTIPALEDLDWLIVMGGPMSVNDENAHPWLKAEKEFIRKCIGSQKTVIGVCLGAQMIANAMGSKVYPGDQKEIGWFKINMHEDTVLGIEAKMPIVFHWHGETFDLPNKARLLASTGVCVNQIFVVGNNVVGMQCHLEMTPASIEGMLENCSGELLDAPFIQTENEIRDGTLKYASLANQVLFELLNALKTNQ